MLADPEATPRATSDDVVTIEPKDVPEAAAQAASLRAALDDYLRDFVKPDGKCPGCDQDLRTGLLGFLTPGARFEWGLTHGEGHCTACRYPARAYHFVGDRSDPRVTFTAVLFYHPSQLRRRSEKAAEPC